MPPDGDVLRFKKELRVLIGLAPSVRRPRPVLAVGESYFTEVEEARPKEKARPKREDEEGAEHRRGP